MTRLFARLWLAAVLLFAGGVVLNDLGDWYLYSQDEGEYWTQFLAGGFALASDLADSGDLDAIRVAYGVDVVETSAPSALSGVTGASLWASETGGDFYYVAVAGDRALKLGPWTPVPLPNPWTRLGLFLLAVAAYGAAFGWVLAPLRRSQEALTAAAESIAAGDLGARVLPRDQAAAPAMAGAFNGMADRLAALLDGQQEILRVASHELRTPISRLRIGVHLLAKADADREERAAAMDRDLTELDDLVDEVLTHARLEQGGVEASTESVDLTDVISSLVSELAPLHPDVSLSGTAHGAVEAVPRLLRRALSNVVRNALRYGRSKVVISTEAADGFVHVLVDDDGPGIAPVDRDRALTPFGRLDENSRHGMGLAIVARAVSYHGGIVRIEDSPQGGCRVRTSWPSV